MRLAGVEPPPRTISLGDVEDGQPTEEWIRAMKLNAERRRN